MNESAPAPVLPPVPLWGRVVAGLVAVIFAFWQFVRPFQFIDFRAAMVWGSENVLAAGEAMLAQPSLDLNRLVKLPVILNGIAGGLWLAMKCAVVFVIVGGVTIAAGRSARFGWLALWWVTFAHGAAYCLSRAVWGRLMAVRDPRQDYTNLPWHQGWLDYLRGEQLRNSIELHWPHLAAALLAALVLCLGCWRKQRAKPKAAEVTPAA